MAKFEINVYDMATEKIVKTYSRNMVSVSLYCKYQDLNDKLSDKKVKNDNELFQNALKKLVLETFPEMTEKEYDEGLNPAETLSLYRSVCNRSLILEENAKN